MILSGNQPLDPAGIASYCYYREQDKSYARSGKIAPILPRERLNFTTLGAYGGRIARKSLTDQRVGCAQKANG